MKPFCFTLEDDDGNEVEHRLPSKWEICDRCHGNGVHDHPAFSNGLSQEDFDEDPDFRENYMAGRYDVRCDDCGGTGKTLVIDEDNLTDDQKALAERYYNDAREQRQHERSDRYTRMMENGGVW